jgi:hypothetical protein
MHWELNKEMWFLSKEANKHHDIWKEMGVKVVEPKNSDGMTKVHALKGYDTDLASIPRFGWALVAPWDVARAAIIHDVLYGALRDALTNKTHDEKLINEMRAAADRVFLEGMSLAEPKIATWKAKPCYWSVRPFGRFAIRSKGMAQT